MLFANTVHTNPTKLTDLPGVRGSHTRCDTTSAPVRRSRGHAQRLSRGIVCLLGMSPSNLTSLTRLGSHTKSSVADVPIVRPRSFLLRGKLYLSYTPVSHFPTLTG